MNISEIYEKMVEFWGKVRHGGVRMRQSARSPSTAFKQVFVRFLVLLAEFRRCRRNNNTHVFAQRKLSRFNAYSLPFAASFLFTSLLVSSLLSFLASIQASKIHARIYINICVQT